MPGDVQNKHVVLYFLGADLMFGVERQGHANRDRMIIIDDGIIPFFNSQEQTL
jgi:hypothetical protein